jgi:hypothetical protein
VIRAVGPVTDAVIVEIIGTGATVDELAEAQAWIASDEPLINTGRRLATGRVRQLVDILAEVEPGEAEDDDGQAGPPVDGARGASPVR